MPYMIRRRIMWPGETYVLKYVDVFVLFFEITETKNEVYGVPSSLQLKTCSSRDVASAIPSSWLSYVHLFFRKNFLRCVVVHEC